jgi:hypothetical protein
LYINGTKEVLLGMLNAPTIIVIVKTQNKKKGKRVNKRNKMFCLRFRDIEDLVWRAILKQKKETGFSNSWLRIQLLKLEQKKIINPEPKKEVLK